MSDTHETTESESTAADEKSETGARLRRRLVLAALILGGLALAAAVADRVIRPGLMLVSIVLLLALVPSAFLIWRCPACRGSSWASHLSFCICVTTISGTVCASGALVGWWCVRLGPVLETRFLATLCVSAGFLAVLAGPVIVVVVRVLRHERRPRLSAVLPLCLLLLALQGFETASHDHRRPLRKIANRCALRTTNPASLSWRQRFLARLYGPLRRLNEAFIAYEQPCPRMVWWLLVQVAAHLAIAGLWVARARELAIGSALFWFWSVVYCVIAVQTDGRGWGMDFSGQWWIS